MSEQIKNIANKLRDKHQQATSLGLSRLGATKHAIIDIENTIDAFERLKEEVKNSWIRADINIAIVEQNEILNELKSRL